MAEYQTCCCCFSLRTGCILIGVISLVFESMIATSTFESSTLLFVASSIGIMSSVLLIGGATKGKPLLLWPWIVVNTKHIILFSFLLAQLEVISFPRTILSISNHFAKKLDTANKDEESEMDLLMLMMPVIIVIAIIVSFLCVFFVYFQYIVYKYASYLRRNEKITSNNSDDLPSVVYRQRISSECV